MQKETYQENQQNEIFKMKDVQNILLKKGPTLICNIYVSKYIFILLIIVMKNGYQNLKLAKISFVDQLEISMTLLLKFEF